MQFETFELLLVTGIVVGPLAVYVICLYLATQLKLDRTPHNTRLLARQVKNFLTVNGVIAALFFLAGIIPLTLMVLSGDRIEVEFCALAAIGVVLGAGLWPMFNIRASFQTDPDDEDYSAPGNLPVISEIFSYRRSLFFLLISFLCWHRRRNREGQLLWLLALSIRSGHELAGAVEDHAATWSGSYATRLRQLAIYLKAGRPLGVALERVPGLLSRWIVAAVQIGDETGTLAEVLNECATEHLSWMKNRFRSGSVASLLIYLACYPWAIAAPVSFVMYFIVPKFKAIFEGFGTDMPAVTEDLIYASDHGQPIFLVLAPFSLVAVGLVLRLDQSGWRNVRARSFRSFYPRYDSAPIMRHMARIIEKGKTLPDGLLAIANSYHRRTVAESVAQVYVATESGGDCWKSFLQRGFLSRRELALIEAAQRSGNLPWALREIADVREKRYIFRVDTVVQFFRPVPVIAMGMLVAWISIALFMPVIKLLNDLS